MDKNTSNDEEVPVICPYGRCQGTGFSGPGQVCQCVKDKYDGIEMPDFFKDIFGGFNAKNN